MVSRPTNTGWKCADVSFSNMNEVVEMIKGPVAIIW